MQNLDQKVMKLFTREVCSGAKEATIKSGIDKIIPNTIIDDFMFEPCGYSMNGLIKGVQRNCKKKKNSISILSFI